MAGHATLSPRFLPPNKKGGGRLPSVWDLLSPLRRLASVFGMGTGMSAAHWPPLGVLSPARRLPGNRAKLFYRKIPAAEPDRRAGGAAERPANLFALIVFMEPAGDTAQLSRAIGAARLCGSPRLRLPSIYGVTYPGP